MPPSATSQPAFHTSVAPLLRKRPRPSTFLTSTPSLLPHHQPLLPYSLPSRGPRMAPALPPHGRCQAMSDSPAPAQRADDAGAAARVPLRHTGMAAEAPELPDASGTFWVAAASEAAVAAFAVLLCSLTGVPALGKGWAVSPRLLLDACLWTVPFSATFWALEKAPTGIQAATEARFKSFFGARSLWEIAVFCVCVALGEELLFRSWLLAGLSSWIIPVPLALTFSSVVFGVLHAYTKVYMLLASLAGLMFGSMFLATGQSLLEPLVVHFLYDFCTIVIMQRKWLAPKKSS